LNEGLISECDEKEKEMMDAGHENGDDDDDDGDPPDVQCQSPTVVGIGSTHQVLCDGGGCLVG
jgi:hypothetical protein